KGAGIHILQNAAHVSTHRLADEQFALEATAVGNGPAQVGSQAPGVGHDLPREWDRGAHLPDKARNSPLEGALGKLSFAAPGTECPGGAPFDVRPTVVFVEAECVADRCGNRVADAAAQGDV